MVSNGSQESVLIRDQKMTYRLGMLALVAVMLSNASIFASPAQSSGTTAFEVAAIKPGDPNNHQSGVHWQAGGRVANTNATVKPCEVIPSGDGEEIKIKSIIIPKYPCGQRYYHIGFCPKCFVLNIKAKRKSIEV